MMVFFMIIREEHMKVTGLTGGIGTGKSTAAEYLGKKGFYHIDADDISRGLTALGSPLLPVIDGIFGPKGNMGRPGHKILNCDGSLDRKALAELVFTDGKKKECLEGIMFREIFRIINEEITKGFNTESVGILLDVPLLFETGLDKKCDCVILLVADEDERIKRVCVRDGITAEDVRNRINSQMSDDEKKRKAEIIIDNSGREEELYAKLDFIFDDLI